jgi:hypothetical protein
MTREIPTWIVSDLHATIDLSVNARHLWRRALTSDRPGSSTLRGHVPRADLPESPAGEDHARAEADQQE